MSAYQDHSFAQFSYRFCLENGQGVPVGYSEAARHYKMSADQAIQTVSFVMEIALRMAEVLNKAIQKRFNFSDSDDSDCKALAERFSTFGEVPSRKVMTN